MTWLHIGPGFSSKAMSIEFYEFPLIKATATGNDFIVSDLMSAEKLSLWNREFAHHPRSQWAKIWCDRTEGLGADGLVILEPLAGMDFAWDFYNSDGSRAEMCGNAARAVSIYMHANYNKKSLTFKTGAGAVRSEILSANEVRVAMPSTGREEKFDGYDFIEAGVPHAVVQVADLQDRNALADRALNIKRRPEFAKSGTNVTFVRALTPSHIETLTHERGVEGFTKSCGTGAVAAARATLMGKENRELTVDVPGGRLYVVWEQGRPFLRGPAHVTGLMRWAREIKK